ncbi:ATG8/AUT7/APG8/PAZ2 [Leishmania donovani]|uniref:ATG8/AUT7/APG8/PAZ2_-__putative n=7 Tax=Leishmania donovani species complex TaxID=38574 RepID=A0A6L0WJ49_LEIIN|nr:putative ATG8/AUT7/APG8/PAZ2 [Leishmania infantum JPCM5]XP_003858697.1 ATG8/AUT7/APG8/PAZ2, putative [Leishmania donovani]CAC9453126.1 ATG8/AUT7/APG8/PAZ2_-__putative [Leishmania infantum]AYU76456.1 ATG8/AUT7/APG8/PAZ2, putative [Leishmania donovani]AYU76458.1 ATG8/AUT7/APG8/PAZ2, putative [Leishmania donovani]TPP42913.1 Autophagy protein Atg8 ubiquitin like family protein [Leishmania donovani]TPP42916.1 Autophagy protein Atg8 ubiquitin like family protein [Leishmania donovani]|eukprot:XP_001463475.1 putative ATG8/AUT7/APG8/PAZ2 [Leishmania infantum JPCM5]
MSAYVLSTPLEARVAKCASLRAANAVPVVVEEAQARGGKAHFSALARETTVAQLVAAVRGFRGVDAKKPVALTVAGCSVSPSATLGELHDACRRADDGMLYVAYTAERCMGAAVCTPCGSCAWDGSTADDDVII